MLGIGKAEPFAQPVGILHDENAKRAEPPHRVARKAARGLDLDHVAQGRELRHAAEHGAENAGFRHHGERPHRMGCEHELHQLHPHPLARQLGKAGARAIAACSPAGSGSPSP